MAQAPGRSPHREASPHSLHEKRQYEHSTSPHSHVSTRAQSQGVFSSPQALRNEPETSGDRDGSAGRSAAAPPRAHHGAAAEGAAGAILCLRAHGSRPGPPRLCPPQPLPRHPRPKTRQRPPLTAMVEGPGRRPSATSSQGSTSLGCAATAIARPRPPSARMPGCGAGGSAGERGALWAGEAPSRSRRFGRSRDPLSLSRLPPN